MITQRIRKCVNLRLQESASLFCGDILSLNGEKLETEGEFQEVLDWGHMGVSGLLGRGHNRDEPMRNVGAKGSFMFWQFRG